MFPLYGRGRVKKEALPSYEIVTGHAPGLFAYMYVKWGTGGWIFIQDMRKVSSRCLPELLSAYLREEKNLLSIYQTAALHNKKGLIFAVNH